MLSRLVMSVARRLPFRLRRWYVPVLGQMFYRAEDASSTFGEIFRRRLYEPILPLPAHPVVVDLGSSLGLFVIFINQRIQGGSILSFEASPKTFAYLRQNVAQIPPSHGNTIEIHNIAISDRNGEIAFFVDSKNETNVAATAYRDISAFGDAADFVATSVPCARLDRFIHSQIDYLKCDIEGAEYVVLEDELLHPARVRQMAVEFHDIGKHYGEFQRIVRTCFARGYRVFAEDNTELSSFEVLRPEMGVPDRSIVLKFCAATA